MARKKVEKKQVNRKKVQSKSPSANKKKISWWRKQKYFRDGYQTTLDNTIANERKESSTDDKGFWNWGRRRVGRIKDEAGAPILTEFENDLYRILRDIGVPFKQAKAYAHDFNTWLDSKGANAEQKIIERDKFIKEVKSKDKKYLEAIRKGKEAEYKKKRDEMTDLVSERAREGKATPFFKRHGPGKWFAGDTYKKLEKKRRKYEDKATTKGEGVYYENYGLPQASTGKKILDYVDDSGKAKFIESKDQFRAKKKRLVDLKQNSKGDKRREYEIQIKKLEKAWGAYERAQGAKGSLGGLKQKTADFTISPQARDKWLGYAKGTNKWFTRNTSRTLMGIGNLGEGISQSAATSISPIQIFQMAWTRLSATLKVLVIFIIFAAVLFIPWGLFYYTGWAIAAAFMFLISLIYWLMISMLNGIAFIAISIVNGVITIIMRMVIFIVEAILQFLVRHHMKVVPVPTWAAGIEGDPYANPEYQADAAELQTAITDGTAHWDNPIVFDYAQAIPSNYWYQGHLLLESSLIAYDQIANIPSLMFAQAPEWQDWMYETVIVKFINILGLDTIGNSFKDWMAVGISNSFESFINFAPPWIVVLVGLLPAIIIGIIIYLVYKKNKMEIISGLTNMRY